VHYLLLVPQHYAFGVVKPTNNELQMTHSEALLKAHAEPLFYLVKSVIYQARNIFFDDAIIFVAGTRQGKVCTLH